MKLSLDAVFNLKGLYLIHNDGIVVKVKEVTTNNVTFTNGVQINTNEFYERIQKMWEYASDDDIKIYEDTLTLKQIEYCKSFLEDNGYYVANLWHVDDVKAKFNCTDDEAQKVLDNSLRNEATREQILFAISMEGDELCLVRANPEF